MDTRKSVKNRCIKIVERIKPKFPALSSTKINIHTWRQPQGSMISFRFFGSHIFVDYKKWGKATDEELTGTLAHELVHLEHSKTAPLYSLIIEFFSYYTSAKARRNIERATDKATIEKGFGRQLLKSSEYRIKVDKNYINFLKKYYLTPQEIKSALKKNKSHR